MENRASGHRAPVGEGARQPSRSSGFLLGLGFGGFVDGIVLHQVLQWHHMVSDVAAYPTTTVAGLEANILGDGLFHLAVWLVVVAGSTLSIHAWRQGRLAPSWGFHLGLLLAGWGAFNLVEGLVDHQLLGLHHVRDDLGGPLSWDLGFLASGVLLLVVGWAIHRRGAAAMQRTVGPQAGALATHPPRPR